MCPWFTYVRGDSTSTFFGRVLFSAIKCQGNKANAVKVAVEATLFGRELSLLSRSLSRFNTDSTQIRIAYCFMSFPMQRSNNSGRKILLKMYHNSDL